MQEQRKEGLEKFEKKLQNAQLTLKKINFYDEKGRVSKTEG